MASSQNQESCIWLLPQEVRDQIYELVLVPQDIPGILPSRLDIVCQAMRLDTRSLYKSKVLQDQIFERYFQCPRTELAYLRRMTRNFRVLFESRYHSLEVATPWSNTIDFVQFKIQFETPVHSSYSNLANLPLVRAYIRAQNSDLWRGASFGPNGMQLEDAALLHQACARLQTWTNSCSPRHFTSALELGVWRYLDQPSMCSLNHFKSVEKPDCMYCQLKSSLQSCKAAACAPLNL